VDLEQAIQAHASWKQKLTICLERPGGTPKAAEIRADSRSELGQWLYGEGKKFASLDEYKILLAEHARFHLAAAKAMETVRAGQATKEEVTQNNDSEFASASRNVVAAITALKDRVAARQRA
jgi:methyl-accepting chemotaxis protein